MTITSVSIFHKGTIKDRYNLREGMGLLEYQAKPSLRDVAHSSCRMVVYIYYITAAGNSISSQLGSSCQGNWYGMENAGCAARLSHAKSHLPVHSPPASQMGRRSGPGLKPSASTVTRTFSFKEKKKDRTKGAHHTIPHPPPPPPDDGDISLVNAGIPI